MLEWIGETLQLNVKVAQGGSVRVGLLDEESRPLSGRSVDDCLPIVGDSLSLPVKWKDSSDLRVHAEQPTRLQVEMTDAKLYSFQMVPSGPDVDQGQQEMP